MPDADTVLPYHRQHGPLLASRSLRHYVHQMLSSREHYFPAQADQQHACRVNSIGIGTLRFPCSLVKQRARYSILSVRLILHLRVYLPYVAPSPILSLSWFHLDKIEKNLEQEEILAVESSGLVFSLIQQV